MKKTFLIFASLVILLLTGCGGKNSQQTPEGIIPRDEMIDIIVDAWIMESGIHLVILDVEQLEPTSVALYDKFFKEHGISKEQFVQSIEYYTNEEQASENFIQECLQRLEEHKEEVTAVSGPVSRPQ